MDAERKPAPEKLTPAPGCDQLYARIGSKGQVLETMRCVVERHYPEDRFHIGVSKDPLIKSYYTWLIDRPLIRP